MLSGSMAKNIRNIVYVKEALHRNEATNEVEPTYPVEEVFADSAKKPSTAATIMGQSRFFPQTVPCSPRKDLRNSLQVSPLKTAMKEKELSSSCNSPLASKAVRFEGTRDFGSKALRIVE